MPPRMADPGLCNGSGGCHGERAPVFGALPRGVQGQSPGQGPGGEAPLKLTRFQQIGHTFSNKQNTANFVENYLCF